MCGNRFIPSLCVFKFFFVHLNICTPCTCSEEKRRRSCFYYPRYQSRQMAELNTTFLSEVLFHGRLSKRRRKRAQPKPGRLHSGHVYQDSSITWDARKSRTSARTSRFLLCTT